MNRLKGIRGFKRFNLVSIPVYIAIIAGLYLAWKYLPIYWEREKLTEIAQNAILSDHKRGTDGVAGAIIDGAQVELGMKLDWDNIEINRYRQTFDVKVTYKVIVKHLFGKKSVHNMKVKTKRRIIN